LTEIRTNEKLFPAFLVCFNDLHRGDDDMKRQTALIVCAVGMLAGGLACFAEDQTTGKKTRPSEKALPTVAEKSTAEPKADGESATGSPEKKSAAKSKSNLPPANRRLPAGYGSLSLTDEQKEKIFRIREEHSAQVKDLQKQLKDLRALMDKEFKAVLTADQKKELTAQSQAKEQEEMEDQSDPEGDDKDPKASSGKSKAKADAELKGKSESENS
jgi:hypothetical protein